MAAALQSDADHPDAHEGDGGYIKCIGCICTVHRVHRVRCVVRRQRRR